MNNDEYDEGYLEKLPSVNLKGTDIDTPETQKLLEGANLAGNRELSLEDKSAYIELLPHDYDYCCAKVVLIGDNHMTNVNSSLAIKDPDVKCPRSTATLDISLFYKDKEQAREIFLWNLVDSSRPQLMHQFYLKGAEVALVVYSIKSNVSIPRLFDWVSVLRQAQFIRDRDRKDENALPRMKVFLVVPLTDRERTPDTLKKIEEVKKTLGFDDHLIINVDSGKIISISLLKNVVQNAIEWSYLRYKVKTQTYSSLEGISQSLVVQMKSLLINKKQPETIFSTREGLYAEFRQTYTAQQAIDDSQLDQCIRWIEMQGFIRSYDLGETLGEVLLLKHELLHKCVLALEKLIKDKDNLTDEQMIKREEITLDRKRFRIEELSERQLLLAVGQELLYLELAFRHQNGKSNNWGFITPFFCERVDARPPDRKDNVVSFSFKGDPRYIYAILVTRLKRIGSIFSLVKWSRNMAIYKKGDATYGVFLQDQGDGGGTLTLFFQENNEEQQKDYLDTCFFFERFVEQHLIALALPKSVRHIFACSNQKCPGSLESLSPDQVDEQREHNKDTAFCWRCGDLISLFCYSIIQGTDMKRNDKGYIEQLNDYANSKIKDDIDGFLQDRYSVYFCYDDSDEAKVKEISEELKKLGETVKIAIIPFLRGDVPPGTLRLKEVEKHLEEADAALVFMGQGDPLSTPQDSRNQEKEKVSEMEKDVLIQKRESVTPAFLPNFKGNSDSLRVFLARRQWVDFRQLETYPLNRLFWGITGINLSRSIEGAHK
jgi:hypothetical protein